MRDILNISSESGNLLCFTKNQHKDDENDKNLLNLCISEFNEYKMEEKPKNKIVDPYYTFFILV